MTLTQMKENVINKFGKNSLEAIYILSLFSKSDTGKFITAYNRIMRGK